jgi:hypothetical protein
MYCPKCRTEYRKGFNTCADCEFALVKELPPAGEKELADNGFHPIRDQIGKTVEFIRSNQKASWIFSLSVGVIFYFAYIFAKNIWAGSIWRFIEYMGSLIEPGSNFNTIKVVLITIGVNVITDLPAAFIASIFCGALIIYVLQKRQLLHYLGAAVSFFLIDVRNWHFWIAPHLGTQISSLMAPFLVSVVLFLLSGCLSNSL